MNTTIRNYEARDLDACMEIFDSNTPPYFDNLERPMFRKWLDAIGSGRIAHKNSDVEEYFVLIQDNVVVACAGYYNVMNGSESRMAWGMVHKAYHKTGLGTEFLLYRIDYIQQQYPLNKLTLGTSQHTFAFYERYYFKVLNFIPNGYGPGLDQYDMVLEI